MNLRRSKPKDNNSHWYNTQSDGRSREKELKGKGISYCATCDARYYNDKEVIVVGGGNSAVEESEYITRFVRS